MGWLSWYYVIIEDGIEHNDCNEMSVVFSKCHCNGLVQDCSNSIANALELLQSCRKPWIYGLHWSLHYHNQYHVELDHVLSYLFVSWMELWYMYFMKKCIVV